MLQFEQQYSTQTAEITAKIGRLVVSADTPSVDSGDLRSQSQSVERLLTEVDDLLDQMELCVREMPSGSGERTKYTARVESYRRDKRALDSELDKARRRLGRHELFAGGSSGGDGGLSENQRTQLINNTERLERTSRKLEDTYRLTLETEEIGASTLRDLSEQRATIQRSRNRMADAEADIGQSSQILNRMIARIIQNRIMVMLVIFALVMFIIIMFYFKL